MDLDELENEDWGNDDVVSTECNLVNPFAWDGAAKESYLGMVLVNATHPREYPIIGDIQVGSPAAGQNIAVGDKLMAGNDVFFIGMSADDVYAHCTTDLPQLVRVKVVKDADDMLNSAGLDDDDADSLDGLEGQMQSAGVSLTDRGAAGFGTLKRSGALGGKKTMSKSEEAGFVDEFEQKLDEEEKYGGPLLKGLYRADPVDIDRSRPRDWVATDPCGRNSHIKCLLLTLIPLIFVGIGTSFDRRDEPIYDGDSKFIQGNIEGGDNHFAATLEDDDYLWLKEMKVERGSNETWGPAADILHHVSQYKCTKNKGLETCTHPAGKVDLLRVTCLGNSLSEWGFGEPCYEYDEQAVFCYAVAAFAALWYLWDVVGSASRKRLKELDSLINHGIDVISSDQAKEYWNNMTSVGVPMFIWDLKAMHTEKRGRKVNVITHRANKFYHVDGWLDGTEPNAKIHYPNRPSRFTLTKMTFKQFFQWRTAEEETRHNTALQKWVELHGKDEHVQATSVYHHPDFQPVMLVGSRSVFANVWAYYFFSLIWMSWPYRMWLERNYGNLWRNFVKTASHVPFLHQQNKFKEAEASIPTLDKPEWGPGSEFRLQSAPDLRDAAGLSSVREEAEIPGQKIYNMQEIREQEAGAAFGRGGTMKRGVSFANGASMFDENNAGSPVSAGMGVTNPLFQDDEEMNGAAYAIGTEGYVEQAPPNYLDAAPNPPSEYTAIDDDDEHAVTSMPLDLDDLDAGMTMDANMFNVDAVSMGGSGNTIKHAKSSNNPLFGMAVEDGDMVQSNNPLFGMDIDEASPFGGGEATGFGAGDMEGVNWEAWGAMAGGGEEAAAEPNFFLNEVVDGFGSDSEGEEATGFGDNEAMAF